MEKAFNRNYSDSHYSFKQADNILLKNGRILDFSKKVIIEQDLLISDGIIKQIGTIKTGSFDGQVLDLAGKMIMPGMLDMHVHFREPGGENKETLMSGAAAAMAGGFTGVCTMPNTTPATDNKEIVEFIKSKFKSHLVDVYPIAAITIGRKGKQLVEIAELIEAGVVAFSDDGSSVGNTLVLRRALEYSRMFNVPIIEHCEDSSLADNGAMNEGFVSTQIGIPGIPSIAEDIVVARNIMLAKYTNGKVHIAHISTAASVELVRRAKDEGVDITCEATPHHFILTDESLVSFDTNLKMNPPLRTQADVDAIITGLRDGTIDVIATDHAPHAIEDKDVEFISAPFGIIGLETALGLIISELVEKHGFSFFDAFEKIAITPYKILGLDIPKIDIGEHANLSIFSPDCEWIVNKDRFKSRARNTPFHNWKLKGKPFKVINNKMTVE